MELACKLVGVEVVLGRNLAAVAERTSEGLVVGKPLETLAKGLG